MAKKNAPSALWSRVERGEPDECWPWLGSVKNGYGRFFADYRERYAHREAYELSYGPVPAGMHIMHICNNKMCCNPGHLQAGTPSENTSAAYRDGLARAGSLHHKTKFDISTIEAIAADPRSQLVIAEAYGISQSHVSRIKNNQTRRWDNAQEA